MKKLYRIIALMLTVIMVSSSLVSCDVLQGLIENIPGLEQQDPGKNDPTPTPIIHTCESKCEICGGCKDETCTMTACKNKCSGHIPAHECESKCETCGKCLDGACTESACADKCPGHVPPHECESICEYCDKCTDQSCEESACADKCPGHDDEKAKAYGYLPIIKEEMAAIYIDTADGDNSWATKYNRNSKLRDEIEYVDATITTSNCEDEYVISGIDAEVKVRGNYTLDYNKKPIRIKFKKKNNLLGLHDGEKYKNWVLLADWKDLSMTNNTVAFYLGNTILGSDGYYCTDFRNVEVYLNGEYWGVYLLVEQQEAKDGRSSVPEVPEVDDVGYTGNNIGYLFEYDGYYTTERDMPNNAGDPTFEMNHQGLPAGSKGYTVKSDIYADTQLDFLKGYMDNVFYIAYQANYNNTFYKFNEDYSGVVLAPEITSAKEAVANVIDLKSLVDTYILNEIAKDLDVDWSSFYLSLNMTEEGNKKVTFEAPWDFDSCFGIIRKENCFATDDLYAANNANPWFQLVKNEDWFWEMVREKWAEMKEYNLFDNLMALIEVERTTYKDYYIKNFNRWPGRVSGGNSECVDVLNTYKDIDTAQGYAVDYLVDWLTKRFAFLDSQWNTVDETVPEDAYVYKLEAEEASLGNFGDKPIRTNKDYASNNSYVGDVANNTTITFTVNAEEATTAYLFAGVSKRTTDRYFAEMFKVTVNGEAVTIPMRLIPAISEGEVDWHTFVSVKLAPIELKAGENTIVFTTISSNATNFDYIEIYSAKQFD